MQIQINSNAIKDTGNIGNGVMMTPAIDGNYWLMRVPLTDKQAIVCFPKFGVIGIGFQIETDWNTNLPSSVDAEKLFAHIKHNKGDDSISDADCIEAIKLLQAAIREHS